MFARYILTGKPAIVINPQGIDYQELKSLNMTLDDLMELIRGCDVSKLSEIEYAIIETNGNLSIIKKSQNEPVTRQDLNIQSKQNSLPINLIMDGKLMVENLKVANVDICFLKENMQKIDVKNIKDIIIFTLDCNGEIFIQAKNKQKAFSLETDYNGVGKW